MPKIDPLAIRVARRWGARIEAERFGREVQRRPGGLVTVGEDEEEKDGDVSGETGAGRSSSLPASQAHRPKLTRPW